MEVIVVDQMSSDSTRSLAVDAGARILETPPTAVYTPPTRSRNLGAAAARGEFLLHLDADMTLAPGTLERAVSSCRTQQLAALTLEEVDVTSGFWAACKALERRAYRGTSIEGARFVRASTFREVGGYDESLGSGEDWDVHARYASRGGIGRLDAAVFHHIGAISIRAQLGKKFNYGRSAAAFVGKHDSSVVAGAMVGAYLRSWRRLLGDPFHAAGFAALRIAEAVAVACGLVTEILTRQRNERHAAERRS